MKELFFICVLLIVGIVVVVESQETTEYWVKDYCAQNEYRINSTPNENLTPDDLICVENNFFK